MDIFSEALRLFQRGGLIMYPLLLCSIFVVAIVLERFRYYRHNTRSSEALRSSLRLQLEAGDWNGAIRACEQSAGATGRILASGLRVQGDIAGMKDAFEGVTAWEAAELRKHLGYLDTIVTLSPLLGLLGTVFGMIGSFSVLDVSNSNPAAITGGVGEALVATAAGLSVAVIALVSHSYFCHRLDSLITEIERSCSLIIDKAKGDLA